jgi:hypothetical protein
VLDCPTHEMWADVMTKPLQGMAFKIMRAELMNCPVNYEDPEVETDKDRTKIPLTAPKMATWKSVVATPFKAPQECVGHKRVSRTIPWKDRRLDRTKYPCGTLGSARLRNKKGKRENRKRLEQNAETIGCSKELTFNMISNNTMPCI